MTATDAPASKLEAAAQPSELTALVESDEVLTLPQTSEHKHQINETTVLDFAHPAQAEDEAQDSTAHTAASVHSDSQQADEPTAQQVDPMAESGEFEMPEEYVPQLSREALERNGEADKYGMGVRLMRVSPLWLLVCGLSFIALVIALNGMTGAAVQVNNASSHIVQPSVTGNQATNQSASSQKAHTPGAASTRSEKTEPAPHDVQPTPTAAPHEDAQPMQPVAAQANSSVPTTREPVASASVAAPARAPQAQLPPQSDAAGRFTLQVGSYNNPVEANEHVARLQRAGFAAQVVAVDLPKRGIWYRVQTGRFNDRADAARYGAQLHAKGAADNFIISELTAQ